MERIICLVIGYIFGLFQTGYIVGKLHHIDIRQQGSESHQVFTALLCVWKQTVPSEKNVAFESPQW